MRRSLINRANISLSSMATVCDEMACGIYFLESCESSTIVFFNTSRSYRKYGKQQRGTILLFNEFALPFDGWPPYLRIKKTHGRSFILNTNQATDFRLLFGKIQGELNNIYRYKHDYLATLLGILILWMNRVAADAE